MVGSVGGERGRLCGGWGVAGDGTAGLEWARAPLGIGIGIGFRIGIGIGIG